jgi:hypothetical protein
MSSQYRTSSTAQQEAQNRCISLTFHLEQFLSPLLIRLDAYLDKRLVKTFTRCIAAILTFRNRGQGLNITELGSYIEEDLSATAGTKRIQRLFTSKKWEASLIHDYLWEIAENQKNEQEDGEERPLCIWDGSVLEKPESENTPGLCRVRSSKAKRLKKRRKGIFNPPGGPPIAVKGLEWTSVILVKKKKAPCFVATTFWSREGEKATTQREQEKSLLWKLAGSWKKSVIHVFDRGYASGPWLHCMDGLDVDFVIRWKKKHKFFNLDGEEGLLSTLTRYKRSIDHKEIWDDQKKCYLKTGIMFLPVKHASSVKSLWVVVVRRGGEPWYLITTIPITTAKEAWNIYWIYRKRWKIETCFRYEKSELAVETVRVFESEKREKILALVSLVHAFLLSLIDEKHEEIREWIFYRYCHRTGRKYREEDCPIYRLRWAISRFWQKYCPQFCFTVLSSSLKRGKVIPNFCSKSSG